MMPLPLELPQAVWINNPAKEDGHNDSDSQEHYTKLEREVSQSH
jgi:hypothetical protein